MFARSVLAVLTALVSVLILCQISFADPAGDDNGPPPRPLADRPIPPEVNRNRDPRNDETAALSQLQDKIRQLIKQVAKLQKTIDVQARQSQEDRDREYRQPNDSRQPEAWSRNPGWQERGEFPPQRMPRRPGMMGERGMMQRRGPRFGPMDRPGMDWPGMTEPGGRMERGPMDRQEPMYRRDEMDHSRQMGRQEPWSRHSQMDERGRFDESTDRSDGRGMGGRGDQMEPQGPPDREDSNGGYTEGRRGMMDGRDEMGRQQPEDRQPPEPPHDRRYQDPQDDRRDDGN